MIEPVHKALPDTGTVLSLVLDHEDSRDGEDCHARHPMDAPHEATLRMELLLRSRLRLGPRFSASPSLFSWSHRNRGASRTAGLRTKA